MNHNNINEAIQILEKAREHPIAYIGGKTPDLALAFLNGFNICLTMTENLGFEQKDTRNAIARSQGLQSTSHSRDLRKQGFSEQEIIEKLFTLEIEAWRQLLKENEG